jgi:hypothetical protein
MVGVTSETLVIPGQKILSDPKVLCCFCAILRRLGSGGSGFEANLGK